MGRENPRHQAGATSTLCSRLKHKKEGDAHVQYSKLVSRFLQHSIYLFVFIFSSSAASGIPDNHANEFGLKCTPSAPDVCIELCDLKNYEACFIAGNVHQFGRQSFPKDIEIAEQYFLRACNIEYSRGCVRLGKIYRDAIDVEENSVRAAELFSEACEANNASGCRELGQLYLDGAVTPPESQNAAILFDKADVLDTSNCEAGDFQKCNRMSKFLQLGIFMDVDEEKAEEFRQKACLAAFSRPCE
jgi:TPR repeat protein